MIEKKQFVYRLVDDHGHVLYIGQHTGFHPGTRVTRHKDKPWWPEVAHCDYEEITGDLKSAEQDLITFWGAYYNQENQQLRTYLEASSTGQLLFEAGDAAGSYYYNGGYFQAGKLKLIRTVLWRRDETVVPGGHHHCLAETPKDFHQDWDFVDFPVLSPKGFIRTMGCIRPSGYAAAHPDCGFEMDHYPFATQKGYDYAPWEKWVENATRRGKVSYTGIHNAPKRARRRPAA